MNTPVRSLLLFSLSIAGAFPAIAQTAAAPTTTAATPATVPVIPPRAVPATGGNSPHETISGRIGANGRTAPMVTITYGRPYSKAPRGGEIRKVWGNLVPWDQVWRIGADEATTLITQKDLVFGDTTIPAGAYTLFMMPSEKGTSQLIINKRIGQWGIPYDDEDKKGEFAKVDLKKDTIEKPVDQFTMAIVNDTASGGGVLKMQWEATQFSVPFKVKP